MNDFFDAAMALNLAILNMGGTAKAINLVVDKKTYQSINHKLLNTMQPFASAFFGQGNPDGLAGNVSTVTYAGVTINIIEKV